MGPGRETPTPSPRGPPAAGGGDVEMGGVQLGGLAQTLTLQLFIFGYCHVPEPLHPWHGPDCEKPQGAWVWAPSTLE